MQSSLVAGLVHKGGIEYLHALYLILSGVVSYGFTDLVFTENVCDWRVMCPLLSDSVKLGIFEFVS